MIKYLSALKYCHVVIGNSSSGLLEAPSFGVPTINIGDRQKGRLQAKSVINCEPTSDSIEEALDLALSNNFLKLAKSAHNPYGDGDTSNKIIAVIKEYVIGERIELKKIFFNREEQ